MPKSQTNQRATLAGPRVTVLIPAFNAERYIADAIGSVLAQTFLDFELLIIDDGSTDATSAVICTFANDKRLRAVSHIENLGRSTTRNHGIDLAHGDYIAFMDADDRCEPERLERQVAYLDARSDITGVGSWMASIDDQARLLTDQIYKLPLDPDEIAYRMLFECSLAQSSMMVRTDVFLDYRYDKEFPVAQDYQLWARMIASCRFANLPECLTQYRRHATQVSVTQTDAQAAADLKIHGLQLAALGIRHNRYDLLRHGCLLKFNGRKPVLEKTGAPLDIDYLRWARAWLESLRAGNLRHRIYPEPAFSNMLVARWLFACRKAARNSPWRLVAVEFFGSELLSAVVFHTWHQAKKR